MKHLLLSFSLLFVSLAATAQLKPRPDAFPPDTTALEPKSVQMADNVDDMASWDRYPTYETYLRMMSRWAETYPQLCHIDTIGVSVRDRLILSMYIEPQTVDDLYRPEFFYSSTIHGDEVTGYVMMLHLIDTLLSSYGTSPEITSLIDGTRISINPLANPDGTYRSGNNSVRGASRYNANNVDLNRNYPDPFAPAKESLEQENRAMIDYVSAHHFRLSANLHGGSEVMNYPWDCFTSLQNPHPAADWWQEVCQRFVDTARVRDNRRFLDVNASGVIAGGDWYVIHGGRQDYINFYHDCLEVTMEISSQKTVGSEQLPAYWNALGQSFINYIGEIHQLPTSPDPPDPPAAIDECASLQSQTSVYPNPTAGEITIVAFENTLATLHDIHGRHIMDIPLEKDANTLYISDLQKGIYFLRIGEKTAKIVIL